MAASTWKLIAAALGSDADTREVVVEGENWLTALRSAREALGEAGGIPAGASCVVNGDGGVTILDGAQRRRYDLSPVAAAAVPGPSPTPALASPPAEAAPPAIVPAPAAAPAAIVPAPAAASPAAEGALVAPSLDEVAVPVSDDGSAGETASASDLPADTGVVSDPPAASEPPDLSDGNANAAAPTPFHVARPAPRPSRAATPVVATPSASSANLEPVRTRSLSPLPMPSIVAVAVAKAIEPELPSEATPPMAARTPPASEPVQASPTTTPAAPVRPSAPPTRPSAAPAQASAAPAQASAAPAQASAAQASAAPVQPTGPLLLLSQRDEDPRPQSPLTYRERLFFVTPGTSADDLELALRITLARLQEELRQLPRGQLVVLAAFDHRFETEPERGPSATLQWKDWRGEAVFEIAGQASPPAPPPDPARTSFVPAAASTPPVPHAPKAPPRWAPPSPGAVPFVPSVSPFAAAQAAAAPAAYPPAPAAYPPAPAAYPPAQPARPPSAPPAAPFPGAFPFAQPNAPFAQPSAPFAQPSAPFARPAPAAAPATFAVPVAPSVQPFAVPAPMAVPTHPAPALLAPNHEVTAHAPMPMQAPPAARVPRATIGYMASPIGQTADATGEQDQRLAQAFESVQDLYFLATPAAGLEFVVQLLGELLPSEALSASLYDLNTDHLRCVAAAGVGADARRAQAIPGSTGLLGVAVRSHRESLVLNDVRSDPRFVPGIDSYAEIAARDMVFFPLIVGVQLVGMLQLINRVGRPNFSEADAAVGAYVATQAAKFVMDHRNRRDA